MNGCGDSKADVVNEGNADAAGCSTPPPPSCVQAGTTGASPQEAKVKLDPVFEIASDLQVKIADLGNACWVVSYFLTHSPELIRIFSAGFLFLKTQEKNLKFENFFLET